MSPLRPTPDPSRPRLLITAGPTYEPIDAVRFIGNRSSGRLGVALAEAAVARSWPTTLLLGPTRFERGGSGGLCVHRFQSTADLDALLLAHLPACDILIMAAAVADYRPRPTSGADHLRTKINRSAQGLVLELEPTPDLLAGCARRRRADQVLVGFALEPRDRLLESAKSKVDRKAVDMIVANPLETMDSEAIEPTLVHAGGHIEQWGMLTKVDFASRLLDAAERALRSRTSAHPSTASSETAAT